MTLKEKLTKAIQDISTLEVVTLTNKVDKQIDLTSSTEDIFTNVKNNLAQANLVGYSKFELDGDAVNFVNHDDNLKGLVEEHKVFVSAAQEARKTIIETVISAAKKGVEGLLK